MNPAEMGGRLRRYLFLARTLPGILAQQEGTASGHSKRAQFLDLHYEPAPNIAQATK
jgi:hypothetical protein